MEDPKFTDETEKPSVSMAEDGIGEEKPEEEKEEEIV
jgi:hypothetical protein